MGYLDQSEIKSIKTGIKKEESYLAGSEISDIYEGIPAQIGQQITEIFTGQGFPQKEKILSPEEKIAPKRKEGYTLKRFGKGLFEGLEEISAISPTTLTGLPSFRPSDISNFINVIEGKLKPDELAKQNLDRIIENYQPYKIISTINDLRIGKLKPEQIGEGVKQSLIGIVKDYEAYKDPLGKFFDDPIQVIFDLSILLGLGGVGMKAIKVARTPKPEIKPAIIPSVAKEFKVPEIVYPEEVGKKLAFGERPIVEKPFEKPIPLMKPPEVSPKPPVSAIAETPLISETAKPVKREIPPPPFKPYKLTEMKPETPTQTISESYFGEQPRKRAPSPETLLGKEKPEIITMKENVALNKQITDEARGAKWGYTFGKKETEAKTKLRIEDIKTKQKEELKTTKQIMFKKFRESQFTVNNIKKDLVEYIKAELPLEERGRFLTDISQAQTKLRQFRIMTKVDNRKEIIRIKQEAEEIKELSKIPTKKIKGERVPQIPVDYQRMLKEITEPIDFTKPSAQTIQKLQRRKEALNKYGDALNMPKKKIEELNRLTKKPLKDMSAEETKKLHETLNYIQARGALKQRLLKYKGKRELDKEIKVAVKSSKNINPNITDWANPTTQDTIKMEVMKTYMDTIHTPRAADMIDGYKNYTGWNANQVKNIGAAELKAKHTKENIVVKAMNEMQEAGVTKLTKDEEIDIMINIRHLEGAQDQVKILQEVYKRTGIPKLTPEKQKIIDIIEKYTNLYTDDIAAIYEELSNKIFPRIKKYIIPIKYEKEMGAVSHEFIEQGRYRTTKTFQGFVEERKKGVTRLPRTDLLNIFDEAINAQQWYLNIQPKLVNLNAVVKSPEYLKTAGEMALNFWTKYMDVVARRGWSSTAKSSPLLRMTRLNLNNAILGYKLSSIVMQPFAVFDAMAYSHSRWGVGATAEIVKEFTKAWINPKYAKQIIKESPALQMRRAGEVAVEEMLETPGKGFWRKFELGGMKLLQEADVRTAAGVQAGLEKILMKNGVKNAHQEAEFLMNMVSGSAEVSYRPLILSSGEGARTWFTFQTFFLNRWGIIMHDLVKAGGLKGNWKQKLNALIGTGIYMAGGIAEEETRRNIYNLLAGKELPPESILKQMATYIPKQIPYFGNLIEAADRGGDADPPLIRTVENVFKGGAGLIKGKTAEAKIKGGLKTTEAIASLLMGKPGTAQLFDITEALMFPKKEKKQKIQQLKRLKGL